MTNEQIEKKLKQLTQQICCSFKNFPPDMTTAQRDAIVSPIEGYIIYNTDTKELNYWNGTDWKIPGSPSYKVYTALLTQSGTSAPVATILENTLGEIPTWSYYSTGAYEVTISGGFINNKTTVFIPNVVTSMAVDSRKLITYGYDVFNAGKIGITTIASLSIGTRVDNILNNTPIEIRIYP